MLRIEEIRKRAGITQAELSRRIEVSQGFVSDMENGKAVPSLDTLVRIAKALNCTLDELVITEPETLVS